MLWTYKCFQTKEVDEKTLCTESARIVLGLYAMPAQTRGGPKTGAAAAARDVTHRAGGAGIFSLLLALARPVSSSSPALALALGGSFPPSRLVVTDPARHGGLANSMDVGDHANDAIALGLYAWLGLRPRDCERQIRWGSPLGPRHRRHTPRGCPSRWRGPSALEAQNWGRPW